VRGKRIGSFAEIQICKLWSPRLNNGGSLVLDCWRGSRLLAEAEVALKKFELERLDYVRIMVYP
jgi:hypothetical protein